MSDSDCDWFDKDDDDLIKDVQKTLKTKQLETTEYITTATNYLDDYIKELNIKAASESTKNATKCKIKINDLRKMAQMSALDVFLYTLTVNYDFYSNQILLNDSQEKIFLYTNALATICRLELPGFHKELLKSFLLNTNLQEHFRLA
ncbi:hypothetical protein DOY81_012994, partial [Sarcophaga bullata]